MVSFTNRYGRILITTNPVTRVFETWKGHTITVCLDNYTNRTNIFITQGREEKEEDVNSYWMILR
jgi:hypothetical protein